MVGRPVNRFGNLARRAYARARDVLAGGTSADAEIASTDEPEADDGDQRHVSNTSLLWEHIKSIADQVNHEQLPTYFPGPSAAAELIGELAEKLDELTMLASEKTTEAVLLSKLREAQLQIDLADGDVNVSQARQGAERRRMIAKQETLAATIADLRKENAALKTELRRAEGRHDRLSARIEPIQRAFRTAALDELERLYLPGGAPSLQGGPRSTGGGSSSESGGG